MPQYFMLELYFVEILIKVQMIFLELHQLERAGDFVLNGRSNGSLPLTRAIGYLEYKKEKDLNRMNKQLQQYQMLKWRNFGKQQIFINGMQWSLINKQQTMSILSLRMYQRKKILSLQQKDYLISQSHKIPKVELDAII